MTAMREAVDIITQQHHSPRFTLVFSHAKDAEEDVFTRHSPHTEWSGEEDENGNDCRARNKFPVDNDKAGWWV